MTLKANRTFQVTGTKYETQLYFQSCLQGISEIGLLLQALQIPNHGNKAPILLRWSERMNREWRKGLLGL
jgi:hypothetical protein